MLEFRRIEAVEFSDEKPECANNRDAERIARRAAKRVMANDDVSLNDVLHLFGLVHPACFNKPPRARPCASTRRYVRGKPASGLYPRNIVPGRL
jgi:hypothetical protein